MTNFESARQFVEMKIRDGNESLSGPGSHKINTKEVVAMLNTIIKEGHVTSILDLGCGDWNWFQGVDLNGANYIGWDAHEGMIQNNTNKYGNSKVSFFVKDIITSKYPQVDLIICRDVLFHLDKKFSQQCVDKVKQSCKMFLSTSFNNVETNENIQRYCSIDNWGFYTINLNIEPFNLEKYLVDARQEKRITTNGQKRYINLYHFN